MGVEKLTCPDCKIEIIIEGLGGPVAVKTVICPSCGKELGHVGGACWRLISIKIPENFRGVLLLTGWP